MQTVRLTVQLRDHKNTRRFTQHLDVPLKNAAQKAAEIASEAAKFMRRKQQEDAET